MKKILTILSIAAISLLILGILKLDPHSNPRLSPVTSKNDSTQKQPRTFQVIKKIAPSSLPKKLHANKGLELSLPEDLAETIKSNKSLRLPLFQHGNAQLSPSKTISKNDSLIVFGRLPDFEKSHYKLHFKQGTLIAGNINLFAEDEHFRITKMPSGTLILSQTDPDFEISMCGCSECLNNPDPS